MPLNKFYIYFHPKYSKQTVDSLLGRKKLWQLDFRVVHRLNDPN
jgi:hypothetical protein